MAFTKEMIQIMLIRWFNVTNQSINTINVTGQSISPIMIDKNANIEQILMIVIDSTTGKLRISQ